MTSASFQRESLLYSLLHGMQLCLGMLQVPLTLDRCGLEGLGRISQMYGVVLLLWPLMDIGLEVYATRLFPTYSLTNQRLLAQQVCRGRLSLWALLALLTSPILFFGSSENRWIWGCAVLYSGGLLLFPGWLLHSLRHSKTVGWCNGLHRLGVILPLWLLPTSWVSWHLVLGTSALSAACFGVLGVWLVSRQGFSYLTSGSFREAFYLIQKSWPNAWHANLGYLFPQLAILWSGMMGHWHHTAILAIVERAVRPTLQAIQALSAPWIAEAGRRWALSQKSLSLRYLEKIYNAGCGLAAIGAALFCYWCVEVGKDATLQIPAAFTAFWVIGCEASVYWVGAVVLGLRNRVGVIVRYQCLALLTTILFALLLSPTVLNLLFSWALCSALPVLFGKIKKLSNVPSYTSSST